MADWGHPDGWTDTVRITNYLPCDQSNLSLDVHIELCKINLTGMLKSIPYRVSYHLNAVLSIRTEAIQL